MPEPTTQVPTTPTTPVTVAPVAPVPSPTVPPVVPAVPATSDPKSNRDIYDEAGRKWRDVANGQKGYIQQVQAAQNAAQAESQTQIDALSVTVAERESAITSLTAQVAELVETANQVPQLSEQIEQLTEQAARADKYRMLMDYPQLLTVQVEQTIEPADGEGEPTVKTVNPLLDLVDNTTLTGDALQSTLNQLIAALPSVGPQQQGNPPPAVQAPMAPNPVEPVTTDDLDSWQARADAAHQQLNANRGDTQALADFQEAHANIRRLMAA